MPIDADPTLRALRIDPDGRPVQIGTSQKFSAIADRTDGTSEDVSSSAVWAIVGGKSGPGTAGTVSGDGRVTGLDDCTCALTASYGGKLATARLRIWKWGLTGVTVQPTNPSIYLDDSIHLEASTTWDDGAGSILVERAPYASWTTLGGASIVTLTPDTYSSGATLLGVGAGVDKVRVTYEPFIGEATVTVIDHSLTGLDVSPYAATIFVDGIASLGATVRYKDGTSSDVTSTATWTSSDPKVATVSNGKVSGMAPGTVTITATSSTVTGTSTITVTSP